MINNLEELDDKLDQIKNFALREHGKRDKLLEQLHENKIQIEEIILDQELLEKVVILFQKTSEFARLQAKKQIETLVTKCLQYVLETDIEFIIELDELRGKANAEFYVVNSTEDMIIKTKPELSRGGGVVDIISLALRIAFLQIHKPRIEGPLILDEPAKHLSEEYVFNVGEFLKQTSEMFNRQIIMVTHNHHLSAISNKAYRVELSGTTSSITVVEP